MQRYARWRAIAVGLTLLGLFLIGLVESVDNGEANYGYRPDPEGTAKFLLELDKPLFADAAPDVISRVRGVDTFLYRAMRKAHEQRYGFPWQCPRQAIGDCVSFGWAQSIYIAQCIDWEEGELSEPPLLPATESIYGGSRVEARGKDGSGRSPVGGYSDGSYGGAAARWCRDWGVVYREPQDNGVDLSEYSGDRAKTYGAYGNGGRGDAGQLDAIAKEHPCQHVALVKTFAEAAAAIESGYPVAVCSMQGFTSTRDSQGFCSPSGRWAHCMAFISVRYGERPGLLCLNSWGPNAQRGPKFPADQPDGSFWVDKQVADRMLAGGDSFAVGSVSGFRWRDLSHEEWMDETR